MIPHADLQGKVAIVTGAAAGIGKALTEAFVAQGIRVAAMDINEGGALELQERFGKDKVFAQHVDVAQAASCRQQVEAAVEHFGEVHILINNAALGMNAVHPKYTQTALQIEDVSEDLWQRFLLVNGCGFFNMSRQVVPIFRRQKWGRIVNVSTSYFTMIRPGYSPYGPVKAVLEAHSLMLARELEGTGVTVNVVIPGGPADTAMVFDEPGLDRATLIPPAMMAPPMIALFTKAGDTVNGRRFIAVEWDPAISDPARQISRSAAWPELAQPLAAMPAKT